MKIIYSHFFTTKYSASILFKIQIQRTSFQRIRRKFAKLKYAWKMAIFVSLFIYLYRRKIIRYTKKLPILTKYHNFSDSIHLKI
jgi:hypothetical protein